MFLSFGTSWLQSPGVVGIGLPVSHRLVYHSSQDEQSQKMIRPRTDTTVIVRIVSEIPGLHHNITKWRTLLALECNCYTLNMQAPSPAGISKHVFITGILFMEVYSKHL